MVCDASENQLNVTPGPPPVIPGFGVVVSPVQIPLPSFDLPTSLIEDFLELIQKLSAIFPSGVFKPIPDFSMKTVFDFVSNVLSQIAPYLSLYNLFTAVLRMFGCIIDILCAIPNPFAIANKLKVLFTECLPPLLAIFPWFALILMIISLLLLLFALIQYIIETIIGIIESIIKNLKILQLGLQLNDAEATLAAAQKIASLLCAIENLLSILVAIAAILSVIETLAKLSGFLICSDEDEDGCCPPGTCPPFIKNTPDGIVVTTGKMIYISQIGFDAENVFSMSPEMAAIFANTIKPVREERWQIFDSVGDSIYPIKTIITPQFPLLNTFYPAEIEYSHDTPINQVPYSVDIRVKVNPGAFGHVDFGQPRFFQIKDCLVVRKPYVGVMQYNNGITITPESLNGTLNIEGGLVYEDDGYTAYIPSGQTEQLTLNTFIHLNDSTASSLPSSDDSVEFEEVTFTWKPNAAALAGLQLTTVGCIPEVNLEKGILNAVLLAEGIEPVAVKMPAVPAGDKVPSLGILPNVSGTLSCMSQAIADFRANVSEAGAAEFQAAALVCLGDLQNQTSSSICSAIIAAVSQTKTELSLDSDVQFTSRPVKVQVALKDFTGSSLGLSIPDTCIPIIEEKLKGMVTFGLISDFKYDGVEKFVANITSKKSGQGTVTVSFEDKIFNLYKIIGENQPASEIVENSLNYTFVAATVSSPTRRDETDIIE